MPRPTDRAEPKPQNGAAAPAILSVDGLVKRYGDLTAVDHVSFDVRPGEIYGLLGPNGAGKTTILGVISGLVRPTAGGVVVGGHAVERDPVAAQRLMGVVPQALALPRSASVMIPISTPRASAKSRSSAIRSNIRTEI